MFKLSERSLSKLQGVHPDLIRVIKEAITGSPYDFGITEGVRSLERQKELVEAKKSTTMKSRHLTGHAIDIMVYVDGKGSWDLDYYKPVIEHIKAVAKLNDVGIECGIDWKSFIDAPHIQLAWKSYP